MIQNGCIRHDPDLVATSIIQLICDDLKYQDKQNDPQYLMLNNKLREDKRMIKIKKQMEREEKRNKKHPKEKQKRTSKFSSKYSDRIASIKEADEMIKLKEQKLKNASKKVKKAKKRPEVPNQARIDRQKNATKSMEELKEDLNVLEFRKEYEETILKPKKDIASKPKSARGRKRKTIK